MNPIMNKFRLSSFLWVKKVPLDWNNWLLPDYDEVSPH